jgi:predicted transcriptional regulator
MELTNMPLCDKCQDSIPEGESHEFAGQVLCDDCYMDAMNPAKSCDPWATYTASRLPDQVLNPNQEKIMDLIREKGQVSPDELIQATGLDMESLKREIASLRHMEMVRGKRQSDGSALFCRFDAPD